MNDRTETGSSFSSGCLREAATRNPISAGPDRVGRSLDVNRRKVAGGSRGMLLKGPDAVGFVPKWGVATRRDNPVPWLSDWG